MKRITIDYSEYQALTSEISNFKKYIHDAEVEKKIRVVKIYHYSYLTRGSSLNPGLSWFNDIERIYSEEDVAEMKDDASGRVILEASKAASELQESRGLVENAERYIRKLTNMSFMRRALFFVTGKPPKR